MTTLELLQQAKAACGQLAWLDSEEKNRAIFAMADAITADSCAILAANAQDLQAAAGHISEVMLDRLRLTQARIDAMADGMRQVAALPELPNLYDYLYLIHTGKMTPAEFDALLARMRAMLGADEEKENIRSMEGSGT